LTVPNDISVAGFDDSIAGQWSNPRLTTVGFRQDEHVASEASRVLTELIALDTLGQIPEAIQEVKLSRELIARESTAELEPWKTFTTNFDPPASLVEI